MTSIQTKTISRTIWIGFRGGLVGMLFLLAACTENTAMPMSPSPTILASSMIPAATTMPLPSMTLQPSTLKPMPTARRKSPLFEALHATIEESPTLESNEFGEDVVLQWVPGWISMFQTANVDPLLRLERYRIRGADELPFSSYPTLDPIAVFLDLKPTAGRDSLWYTPGIIVDEKGEWFSLAVLFTFDFENDTMMLIDIHLGPPVVFRREYDALIAEGLSELELLQTLVEMWLEEYTVEGTHPFEQLDDYSIDQIEPYVNADGREVYLVVFSIKPTQHSSNWTSGAFSGAYDDEEIWFRGIQQFFDITYQGDSILFESLP